MCALPQLSSQRLHWAHHYSLSSPRLSSPPILTPHSPAWGRVTSPAWILQCTIFYSSPSQDFVHTGITSDFVKDSSTGCIPRACLSSKREQYCWSMDHKYKSPNQSPWTQSCTFPQPITLPPKWPFQGVNMTMPLPHLNRWIDRFNNKIFYPACRFQSLNDNLKEIPLMLRPLFRPMKYNYPDMGPRQRYFSIALQVI